MFQQDILATVVKIACMLHRRSFLSISGGFALSTLLGGCAAASDAALQIKILKGSVSPQLIAAFRRQYGDQASSLKFRPVEQLTELFAELEAWRDFDSTQTEEKPLWQRFKASAPADLVMLGHGWLRQAIAAQLIQPLPMDQLEIWEKLPAFWQDFVQRDQQGDFAADSDAGKVWGIPYRWGTTVILYRKDKLKKLGWEPQDWSDLWREDLGDRLSLLNHSREGIGLVLKKMGHSYNETNLGAIAGLEAELQALHKNVKFYSSTNYLQPLINDDTWVAQAWSQDALPLLKRYPNLGAIVPKSGTSIWCDLWVQPIKNNQDFQALQQWLEFCWEAAGVNQLALSANSASPLIYDTKVVDPKVKNNPLIWVAPNIFQQSEIIHDLEPTVTAEYQKLWRKIRQA
ncbi:MAG: extracellular solute-binding protein [Limnothrix sp.]